MGGGERQSSLRNPPVLFALTGNQEAPAPAFCTFQPVGLSRRSCQGLSLLPGSRLQALQPEAQPSPRSLGVPTVVSEGLGRAAAYLLPSPVGRACR